MSNQQKENKNKLLELAAEQSKNDKIPTGTGSGSGLKKVIFEALETVQKKKPESMISVSEIMEEIHKALPEARATRVRTILRNVRENPDMTKNGFHYKFLESEKVLKFGTHSDCSYKIVKVKK